MLARSIGLLVSLSLMASVAYSAQSVEERIKAIKARLRAETGTEEVLTESYEDLPMVKVTVLPGDTHKSLALDLTGEVATTRILKAIEPTLKPGSEIELPRSLLRPRLSDPGLVEFRIGKPYNTLWSLVTKELNVSGATAPLVTRNIQRLNGITRGDRLRIGQRIQVPEALLKKSRRAVPALKFHDDYLVTKTKKLKRRPPAKRLTSKMARKIKKQGLWARQQEMAPVSLAVIHTPEHNGAPFGNVARYMQTHKLANYLISPKGNVYRIVPEKYRANGCGESLWDGRYDIDQEAINIEIFADTAPGSKRKGISAVQYKALDKLLSNIHARRPILHPGRVVTHRMVAASYRYGTRSRKGDPYTFDWEAAGLPNNAALIDRDVLLKRVRVVRDKRYTDRITVGQRSAEKLLREM